MTRNPAIVFRLAIFGGWLPLCCLSNQGRTIKDYFRDSIGLSQGQFADIQNGKAVAKVLKSRTPAEIFIFGAVYIKASPQSYVQLAVDFDRLLTIRIASELRQPTILISHGGVLMTAADVLWKRYWTGARKLFPDFRATESTASWNLSAPSLR